MKYLNERIGLLRLFKSGNIRFRDVFFYYTFAVMGFIENTIDHCNQNQTRNVIASEQFTLNESLHEGNGSNISDSELYELENITREVLKKCLVRCKSEYVSTSSVTWDVIKDKIMNELIAQVTSLKNMGVLPT